MVRKWGQQAQLHISNKQDHTECSSLPSKAAQSSCINRSSPPCSPGRQAGIPTTQPGRLVMAQIIIYIDFVCCMRGCQAAQGRELLRWEFPLKILTEKWDADWEGNGWDQINSIFCRALQKPPIFPWQGSNSAVIYTTGNWEPCPYLTGIYPCRKVSRFWGLWEEIKSFPCFIPHLCVFIYSTRFLTIR